jgi:hypothetical protein
VDGVLGPSFRGIMGVGNLEGARTHMNLSWRIVRRTALVSTILFVSAGFVAWFWPNAGYDMNRVHPVIRELQEPFREVLALYYLDGGSIRILIVDATGRELSLVFPVDSEVLDDGRITATYSTMFIGDKSDPNRVELPFTQDSMNRAIEIADEFGLTYSDEGYARTGTLFSYRHFPRDAMRAVWWRLWCDFD